MQFNEIIVFGAGAIGSLYGSLLSEFYPVTLIGRKKHVKEIRKNGLTITGTMFKKIRVRAETDLKYVSDNALLILSTKAKDNELVINQIKDKLKEDTVIMVMQNGLGSEEIVKKILPKNEVIRAIIMTGVSFLKPGTITLSGLDDCNIQISKSSKKIERIFRKANLPCKILGKKEFKKYLFEKTIINSFLNTLTALMEVKNKEVMGNNLLETRKNLIKEGCLIAKAESVLIDEKELFDYAQKVLGESTNKTSMFQDLLKGKKTEIELINGKLIELGKKHGINTPVNKTIYELIKFKEKLLECQ